MNLTTASRLRNEAIELLLELTDADLAELLRPGRIVALADGHTAGSGSEGGSGGLGGHSDPVASMVCSAAGGHVEREGVTASSDAWPQRPDPLGDALRLIFDDWLPEIARMARGIERRKQQVLHAADSARARRPGAGGVCDVCDRVVAGTAASKVLGIAEDRLRGIGGGFACDTDRRQWERDGRPLAGPEFERWLAKRRPAALERERRRSEAMVSESQEQGTG